MCHFMTDLQSAIVNVSLYARVTGSNIFVVFLAISWSSGHVQKKNGFSMLTSLHVYVLQIPKILPIY